MECLAYYKQDASKSLNTDENVSPSVKQPGSRWNIESLIDTLWSRLSAKGIMVEIGRQGIYNKYK